MKKLLLFSLIIPLAFADSIRTCESSLGFLSTPEISNNLVPGLYTEWACENTSMLPMDLTLIKCRTDGTATIDVLAMGMDHQFHSVLTSPLVCSSNVTTGQPILGSTYPAGTPLTLKYTVGTLTNQVTIIVSEIDRTPFTFFTVDFENKIKLVVLGSTHSRGTADLAIQCYSTGNSMGRVSIPASWVVNEFTLDVTINFSSPKTGRCVIR